MNTELVTETTIDLVTEAMKMLKDKSIVSKMFRGKLKHAYVPGVAIRLRCGELVAATRLQVEIIEGCLNETPLDMDILAMASSPEEVRDLLPFTNYAGGMQLVTDPEFYSSVKLDSIFGRGNYAFAIMKDGRTQMFLKITMDGQADVPFRLPLKK
jgi:hypothetical protein